MTPGDPKFVTRELRATPGIRAFPSEDRTASRMKALRAAPPGGYQWKEARDHFRDLARGDPDHLGRRLYTDAGKSNARYVARVAWRAYHAKEVPTTARQWGLLEAAIRRSFEELETWGLPATRVSRPLSTL